MKEKIKLLTCVGSMVLLTTAILPSTAMGAEQATTTNYKDLSYFSAAFKWCKRGFNKDANCCSTEPNDDHGHPGTRSLFNYSPDPSDIGYECDLWGKDYNLVGDAY